MNEYLCIHFTQWTKTFTVCTKWIGLDWIGFWPTKPDWTGSGSPANGLGLDWILSNESVSYSDVCGVAWRHWQWHPKTSFEPPQKAFGLLQKIPLDLPLHHEHATEMPYNVERAIVLPRLSNGRFGSCTLHRVTCITYNGAISSAEAPDLSTGAVCVGTGGQCMLSNGSCLQGQTTIPSGCGDGQDCCLQGRSVVWSSYVSFRSHQLNELRGWQRLRTCSLFRFNSSIASIASIECWSIAGLFADYAYPRPVINIM